MHAWVGREAEGAGIGEAFRAGPGGFGGEAEESEDLEDRSSYGVDMERMGTLSPLITDPLHSYLAVMALS